jgi:hypothetical protein
VITQKSNFIYLRGAAERGRKDKIFNPFKKIIFSHIVNLKITVNSFINKVNTFPFFNYLIIYFFLYDKWLCAMKHPNSYLTLTHHKYYNFWALENPQKKSDVIM